MARDLKRWNITIHHILFKAEIELPQNILQGPEWDWAKGLSAEEVYDRLLLEAKRG